MAEIGVNDEGVLLIADAGETASYLPYAVTLPDGTVVEHESRGGTLSSAGVAEVGALFLEIAYLGDGPAGGELVVSVSGATPHVVAIGALWTAEPLTTVPPSWPAAVDLALGLTTADTQIVSGSTIVSRDELEAFHQRLLGALHG